MSVTFLLGPPRSGTTLLKDLLAAHPDLAVHGEDFHPFHHDLTRLRWRTEREDHFRFTAGDVDPELSAAYQAAVAQTLGSGGQRHFVLKVSTLSIQVDYLRALFPEANLVQLVRDGRDAACSMEDLRRELERQAGRPRDLGPAPDPLGLWCARQGHPGLVRAGASWAYHAARSWLDLRFAGAASGPERVRRYRYEDLVADPAAVLADVQALIGVAPAPSVAALAPRVRDAPLPREPLGFSTTQTAGPRRVGRHADDMSPAVRTVLAPVLELPMRLLGYAPDPWPEVDSFFAACRELGMDPEAWRDRAKGEAAWFSLHHGAFSPERLLRPFATAPDARPLLVDGAVISSRRTVVDGGLTGAVSAVQKQDRRHEFEDPNAAWVGLAPRLDGQTPLSTLLRDLQDAPAAVAVLARLYDLGFVAFA